jgi:hypothetical protein
MNKKMKDYVEDFKGLKLVDMYKNGDDGLQKVHKTIMEFIHEKKIELLLAWWAENGFAPHETVLCDFRSGSIFRKATPEEISMIDNRWYEKNSPCPERENNMSDVKVTKEQVDAIISASKKESVKMGEKSTVVSVTLPNGFVIVESSSCVDSNNYDHEVGIKICMERVENKVWELEGYLLQSKTSI